MLGERPYRVRRQQRGWVWIHDFEIVRQDGGELNINGDAGNLRQMLHRVWQGEAENDGFNQLVLDTGYNHSAMFDFYKGEMPKFGWEEITAVRTNQSVMAYTREERVATIQIESVRLGGSAVRMVVAPRNPGGSESAQRLFRPSTSVAKEAMPVIPVN